MKKGGYIYIITIFVVLLISMGIYFIQTTPMKVVRNSYDSIQGNYIVESIGNYILSENFSDKIIYTYSLGRDENLDLSEFNYFQNLDKKRANLRIDTRYELPKFVVDIEIEYKGIPYKGSVGGDIVNPIFKDVRSILNMEVTEEKDLFEEFREAISNWNILNTEGFRGKICDYSDAVVILNENNIVIRNLYDNSLVENLSDLNILRFNDVLLENVTINGILIVRGNLETSGSVQLNGICIIDGGTVKGNLKVNGLTINLYSTDDSGVFSNYNKLTLRVLGKYLPEFFKPKVKYMKKSEDLYF